MAAKNDNVCIQFSVDGNLYEANVDKKISDFVTSPVFGAEQKLNMLRRLSKVSTKIQSTTSTNLHIDMPTTSVAANERKETESSCNEKTIPHFWTDAEERALIHLRLPMEKEFNKGEKAHSTLWGRIKVEMLKLNFDGSVTQIINKWNTLKKKYRKVSDNNNRTGNERQEFKYQEEFDQVFVNRAATVPTKLFDSTSTSDATPPPKKKLCRKTSATCTAGPDSDSCEKAQQSNSRSVRTKQIQVMESIQDVGQKMLADANQMHKEKMDRFDRFLDILEKGMNK